MTPPRLAIPPHTADDARRAARSVLGRAEFDEPPTPLLERLQEALFELVGRLLARIVEGATGSPIGWLVTALVAAALVALVVRFARGVTRDPAREAAGGPVARRAARDWRAEAAALEGAGEWRAALRCRYRALVADLAARGLVDEVPGRTAGEYRAEVAENVPLVAEPFAGATTLFERAWYGGAAVGAGDASRFRALESQVLEGAS